MSFTQFSANVALAVALAAMAGNASLNVHPPILG